MEHTLVQMLVIGLELVAGLLLLYAALCDLASRTIPDGASILLLLAGVVLQSAQGDLPVALMAAGLTFVVCAAIWLLGLLGGGDVKLMAASMLVVPAHKTLDLAVLVPLSGGVLAIVYLLLGCIARPPGRRDRPLPFWRRTLRAEQWRIARRGPLPYGVAIAASAIALFFTRVFEI
ncbi:A24 family peptidase [Acetobacter papayae]|uniref:A24 family peptidase n=1 Tax=Acetobacter papayae TaxID=1076592 RepID=UPI0039EC6C0A